MEWIPVVTKTYRLLLSKGRNVEIEEVRKWFQPLMPGLGDRIDDLLSLESLNKLIEDALPEGPWQPAVALSQTLLLLGVPGIDIEELDRRIGLLLKVWDENPVNYSALLSELRRRTISLGKPDGSIVETLTFDPQKPSYFSSEYSESGTDFFLNYLRFDEGIDVDALLDPLRKLLEKDPLVEDFLRLTGIDLLLKPSDFVSRIDRAVDIFLKAKEQGLDPEKILKKWDELANNGGDRFVYLEEAVKRVASEEINSSFWKAVKEALSEKGIKVSGTGGAVAGDLFYLNLINIEGTSVDVSPMKDVLDDLSSYLRQVRPIAFFTAEEIEKVLRSIGVGKTVDADIVKKNARILASLDRFSSTYVFDNDVPIFEIVNHSEEPPEEVAKRVSSAIKEAHTEGLSGETLLEYLRKRIQS